MKSNEKLDALKHISTIHRSQFDERRIYEWKVVLTTLSFYMMAVASVIFNKIDIKDNILVVWLLFVGLALVTNFYLLRIHIANHKNLLIAESAEKFIVKTINNSEKPVFIKSDDSYFCHSRVFNWILQSVSVLIFAISAAAFLSRYATQNK